MRVASAREWLVALLLLALPWYGWTAAATGMLGARHVHQAAGSVAPMTGWNDFRRGLATTTVRLSHVHAHSQDGLQRHHHDVADRSVVRLGGDNDDESSSAAGAASLVLAPPFALTIGALTWTTARWGLAVVLRFASWSPDRLDRPPRA